MTILNYRYRLMPTPAQADVLMRSMNKIGWGWNLMVRRTEKALRMIRRGHARTCQVRLAEYAANKEFVGPRAGSVIKLVAAGMTKEAAKNAVSREMSAKAFTYQRSHLAMKLAMAEADAAKQREVGSALGGAWAQLGKKYQLAWEACWNGLREAPRRAPIKDAAWIQAQINVPAPEACFRYAEACGPHSENWVDLSRFFPTRLTTFPGRIKNGTDKCLSGLKGPDKAREILRLKREFRAIAEVRFIMHRPVPEGSTIKNLKITRRGKGPSAEWHLIMALNVPEALATKVYPVTSKACGINPSRHQAMSVVSEDIITPGVDGFEAGPDRPLARAQKLIARLQRKLQRQMRANNPDCYDEKGRWIKGKRAAVTSKKMAKTKARIRILMGRVANQRKETYHKIVEDLLNRFDTIYMGEWRDDSSKVRRAKKLQRKTAFAKTGAKRAPGVAFLEKMAYKMDRDNALGVFRKILVEKIARSAGFKNLVLVPESHTTKTCAKCLALTGPAGISKHGWWWTCEACGHKQLRGRTAAWNILQFGAKAASMQSRDPKSQSTNEALNTPLPTQEKGARQALKGGGNTAVGRMPPPGGEGAQASRSARGTRKALTPMASAMGRSALIRATSSANSSLIRGMGEGESPATMPGEAFWADRRDRADEHPGESRPPSRHRSNSSDLHETMEPPPGT